MGGGVRPEGSIDPPPPETKTRFPLVQGMYTVLESNLEQYMEIIGVVLPSIFMGFAGFVNNGGCSCGCGVPCDSPFVRWDCPGDIGYACTGDLDATLLVGDPTRAAPCTQTPFAVEFLIRLFCMGFPALMMLVRPSTSPCPRDAWRVGR